MQVFWDLRAGDLSIVGSSLFADHTRRLLPMDEYERKMGGYCMMLGFPGDGPGFASHVRTWLDETAHRTDRSFPANEALRIERGEPILTPAAARPNPESLPELRAPIFSIPSSRPNVRKNCPKRSTATRMARAPPYSGWPIF